MPRPMFMSPRIGSRICSKLWRCRGIEKSVSCRPRMYMKLSGVSGSPLSRCWKEMAPVGWSLTHAVSSNETIFMSSPVVSAGGGCAGRCVQHEPVQRNDGDGARRADDPGDDEDGAHAERG